jgi:hypothetical protein
MRHTAGTEGRSEALQAIKDAAQERGVGERLSCPDLRSGKRGADDSLRQRPCDRPGVIGGRRIGLGSDRDCARRLFFA